MKTTCCCSSIVAFSPLSSFKGEVQGDARTQFSRELLQFANGHLLEIPSVTLWEFVWSVTPSETRETIQ